jgi:hypothetical protein
MAQYVRLALAALVCGCVDLAPPAGVTITPDARPEQEDAATDALQPDVPDDPDVGTEPDTAPVDPDAAVDGPGLLLINGSSCSGGEQCQSGVCTEGVCCDRACGVTCWSCKVTGAVGTCSPTTGVTCASGSCSGSTETPASTCNSAGTCAAPPARSCGAYQCAGTSCGTSCTTAGQCTSGNTCFAAGCVSQASLPALYWSFDEASGSTAFDGSGNGRDGQYTGDVGVPDPVTDVPSLMFPDTRSRSFNLDNRDAVRLTLPAALKPANDLTITVWYKATRVDTLNTLDGSDLVSAGDQYMLRLTTTGLLFVKRTATPFDRCEGVFASALDGQWHHVAAVASTSGMKVHVDGVERCSNALGDPIVYTAGADLWVGRHGNGDLDRDFDGQIDEVRIYTRVLSAGEIAALAAGGR